MLRLLPFMVLVGCTLPEDDDEPPPAICGDGVVGSDESCDDGNTADGDRCSSTCQSVEQYTVHWRTSSVATGTHSCPAGFDLAKVVVQPVIATGDCRPVEDCAFEQNGPWVVFTSPCDDGAERIQMPPSQSYAQEGYRVSVRFASSASGEDYGETLQTWLREVTDTILYEESGFVHLAWSFRNPSGTALDCFNANVPDVTIKLTDSANWQTSVTIPCMKLSAYTPPVVAGLYTVDVVTTQGSTTLAGVAIEPRSAVTELGTVTVTVPGA